MLKLTMMILGLVVLCGATTVRAADAPAAPAAPALMEAVAAAPLFFADDMTPNPEFMITLPCPPEPITSCESCFYFGQTLSYTCTTYCQNGVPRRTCGGCGSGCPQ